MPEVDYAGTGGDGVLESSYVDGGELLIGKLVGTVLGSLWLTVVSGWITVTEAIATVHIRFIRAGGNAYAGILESLGREAQATIATSWAAAFEASVEVNPLFAPAIFSAEILVVVAIVLVLRRRVLT